MDSVTPDNQASAQVSAVAVESPDPASTKGALSPQDVLDRWECLGGKVRQSGTNWSGLCLHPDHDDRIPSVSFREIDERTFAIYCHVCSPGNQRQYFEWFLAHIQGQQTDAQLAKAQEIRSKRRSVQWKPSNVEYIYQDADGRPVAKKVRGENYDPEEPAKRSFRWHINLAPAGKQPSWQMSYGSKPSSMEIPLYRLPQLRQAIEAGLEVGLTEGESDCEALVKAGLAATSVPNGAGGVWQPQWTEQLKGASKVWVYADNDKPGLKHAEKVCQELTEAGLTVAVLRPPYAKDVREHLESGRQLSELVEVEAAPTVEPSPASEATSIADIEREHIRWAWPRYLAFGKLHIVEGDPGTGKSFVTLDIAARMSVAASMPDGSLCAQPVSTLICTVEDGPADTIRPRLEYAGADLSRFWFVHNGALDPLFSIPNHLPALERLIRTTGATLVIIDPLNAYLSEKADSYNDQKVRTALTPLATLAAQTGVILLVVRHWRKGSGSAIQRGAGSMGLVGAARFTYSVGVDPEEPSRRVLAPVKRNIGEQPPSLSFQFTKIHGDEDFARIDWLGTSQVSADQLAYQGGERTSEMDDAVDADEATRWLKNYLEKRDRQAPASEVIKAAEKDGIGLRKLQRAREKIADTGHGEALNSGWTWTLRSEDDTKMTNMTANETLSPSSPSVSPSDSHTTEPGQPESTQYAVRREQDHCEGSDEDSSQLATPFAQLTLPSDQEPEPASAPSVDSPRPKEGARQLSNAEIEAWRQQPMICDECGTDVDVMGWEHPLWIRRCLDHDPSDAEISEPGSDALSLSKKDS